MTDVVPGGKEVKVRSDKGVVQTVPISILTSFNVTENLYKMIMVKDANSSNGRSIPSHESADEDEILERPRR